MVLPSPGAVPPTVPLPEPDVTTNPEPVLGIGRVPDAFVPIRLPRIRLPLDVPRISIPLPPLPEITFPAPATAPPMTFGPASVMLIPRVLGSATVPVRATPMRLPWRTLPDVPERIRMPSPL